MNPSDQLSIRCNQGYLSSTFSSGSLCCSVNLLVHKYQRQDVTLLNSSIHPDLLSLSLYGPYCNLETDSQNSRLLNTSFLALNSDEVKNLQLGIKLLV